MRLIPEMTKVRRKCSQKNVVKKKVKRKKTHIKGKEALSVGQDKEAQARFLEHPELVELTIWKSFEVICADMVKPLVRQTNR